MSITEKLQPLMQEWLLNIKKNQVSSRTFEKLNSFATLHIYPSLGDFLINEFDSQTIEKFLFETLYKEKKLSPESIKKCKSLFNDFFNYCCKTAQISKNPVKASSAKELKVSNQPKSKGLNPKDRELFIDTISTHRFWKPFCLMIMFTGIRIGEILALKWQDIDFENRTVQIENIVGAGLEFDKTGAVVKRGHYVQPYKNPLSRRIIPLSDNMADILLDYRRYREREQRGQRRYSYLADEDLVFGNEKSELRSYTGISHLLAKFLKYRGLGELNITFNVLRQTHKDMLREAAKGLTVTKWFSSDIAPGSTLEIYKDVAPEKNSAIQEYLRVKKKDFEM